MTTETSERENIVCGAKLAEQGGHYDETRSSYGSALRAPRRLNLSIEQKKVAEMNNNDCGQVKNNAIRDICSDILNVLEKHLIPCTSIGESLVFYYKMKGDYYRYLAEFVTSSDRKDAAENALVAYKKTSDIAMTDLPPTHPLRLDLVLNFSMLYDDILNSPDRAYQLAFGAIGELKTFSDDSDRGSDAILQLLREKIKLWKAADRLKQLSEIQRYLDDQVINEDYPGIVIEFRDSRLVEFIYIATSKQTSETVHFKNLALSPIGIIRAIRDKVIPAGVRCVSTSSLIVFVPNTFQQCTNILVALSYYISDPWFQSVLRQMPSGPFLGYISSLTTNKITDMEPLKLEIPLQLQPFQESEVEKV